MTKPELINTGSVILGSMERFDLRSVPFSTMGSYMCILEDQEDRSLYLSISRSPAFTMERKNLIKVVPIIDNKEIPFEYSVEPGKMTIKTYRGSAEICFDGQKQVRIRGDGISLRFCFKMRIFEYCSPKENGDFEISYEVLGKLLFVPIKGAVWCNAKWNCNTVQTDDFIIDLIPPVETMKFETAIHEYYSNRTRDKEYSLFDDCVKTAEEDFKEFCKKFRKVPEKYSKMAKLAAWTIWTHHMGPEGKLKSSVVYMSRITRVRAFGYQQCYQAMASSDNVREAWRMLLTMFDYQNEAGQIPNNVNDTSISYLAASFPMQGAALDYILKVSDFEELKKEDYAELYSRMSRYAGWLLTKRDRNRSGIPQYYHADESGWICATAFKNGRPVQSGDLLAFMVLLTEYCGKLAVMAGIECEDNKWINESRRLLTILENEFWNGKQFISKDAQTGEIVETGIIASLLPIILGKRLREDIINTIASILENEGEYLTPGGRVKVITPIHLLLLIGLKNAGKEEIAYRIAVRYCDLVCKAGLSNRLSPFEEGSFSGLQAETCIPDYRGNITAKCDKEKREPETLNEWTSETSAIFLTVASYVLGEK